MEPQPPEPSEVNSLPGEPAQVPRENSTSTAATPLLDSHPPSSTSTPTSNKPQSDRQSNQTANWTKAMDGLGSPLAVEKTNDMKSEPGEPAQPSSETRPVLMMKRTGRKRRVESSGPSFRQRPVKPTDAHPIARLSLDSLYSLVSKVPSTPLASPGSHTAVPRNRSSEPRNAKNGTDVSRTSSFERATPGSPARSMSVDRRIGPTWKDMRLQQLRPSTPLRSRQETAPQSVSSYFKPTDLIDVSDNKKSPVPLGSVDPESNSERVSPNPLLMATPNRPYARWREKSGESITHSLWIIPDGYTLDDTFNGYPWICPIRTCRHVFSTSTNLADHFTLHAGLMLNDNGDGTLSVIGNYDRTSLGTATDSAMKPIVISKKPLDPKEGRMADPSLPLSETRLARPTPPSRHSVEAVQTTHDSSDAHEYEPSTETVNTQLDQDRDQGESDNGDDMQSDDQSTSSDDDSASNPLDNVPGDTFGDIFDDIFDDASESVSDDASENLSDNEHTPSETGVSDSPQEIKKAPSGRPYASWIDESSGNLSIGFGVLIPDGYQTVDDIPGYPMICPIRSCRTVFKQLLNLGAHFAAKHWGRLLNDNLDGTLSDIGSYNIISESSKQRPRGMVVSQKPLDPDEPPMVEPHVSRAEQAHFAKHAARRVLVQPKPRLTPKRNLKHPESGNGALALTGNSQAMWKYIQLYLDPPTHEPPDQNHLELLLPLPRVRDLEWSRTHKQHKQKQSFTARQPRTLASLVVQVTGERARKPCTKCTAGLARPFEGCVIISAEADPVAKRAIRSCANCYYYGLEAHCSLVEPAEDGTVFELPAKQFSDRAAISEEKIKAARARKQIESQKSWSSSALISTPISNTAQKEKMRGQTSTSTSDDRAKETWEYARPLLNTNTYDSGPPENMWIRELLTLPRKRDMDWNRPWLNVRNDEWRATLKNDVVAVIVHLTGDRAKDPCLSCAKKQGPFASCVVAPASASDVLRNNVRACANCFTKNKQVKCSFYAIPPNDPSLVLKAGRKPRGPHVPSKRRIDEYAEDAEDEADTVLSVVSKGTKLSEEEAFAASARQAAETALVPESVGIRLRRKRQKAANFSRDSLASSDVDDRIRPPKPAGTNRQALDHEGSMEAWEIAPGRISNQDGDDYIAYSKAFISTNRMVRLYDDYAVRVDEVRAGEVLRWVADPEHRRVCLVITGKLQVRVDGSDEFVVGPRGTFKVPSGVACSITNKWYADSTLHVSMLPLSLDDL